MDPNLNQVLEAQVTNERTILDYLNEDCWHAVLNYLSVKKILCTERTSRHWQRVMLAYLSHVKIHIDEWSSEEWKNHRNHLIIRFDAGYSSFLLWTYKLGASVVSFQNYCRDDDDDGIEVLGKNCPNLEKIKLMMLMKQIPANSNAAEECFPCLKQICLDYCKNMTDDCISQFLASTVLEELKILTNVRMTGLCLLNLKSEKLKSLVLRSCWALEFSPLLTVADRFSGLTKLALARACDDIRDNIHILLDKLPKLEYLTVLIDDRGINERSSNIFFQSVCRLKRLRHLSSNFYTWDQHLEEVTKCCNELEVLKLHCWNVTSRGARAVLCMGPRLTQLDLAYSSVTDEDVVALVYACPNLTWLRLTACEQLRGAVMRVAIARREQRASTLLHMVLEQCYSIDYKKEELEDVLKLGYRDDENDSDGVEDSY